MRTALRIGIAVLIILALLPLFGGGWVPTLGIALIGFGTGRAVEHAVYGPEGAAAEGPPNRRMLWAALAGIGLGVGLVMAVQVAAQIEVRRAEEDRSRLYPKGAEVEEEGE